MPFKKGQISAFKGHKHLKETKEKISKAKKGVKRSNETIKKISKALKGSKSYLWKGGITPLNKQIRNCFEFRQWHSDVFTRDDFTCQTCGARSGKGKVVYLQAHHIKSFAKILEEYQIKTFKQAINCEELWNINNGLTLCIDCHKKTDTYLNNYSKRTKFR